jgi:hypothetical protein
MPTKRLSRRSVLRGVLRTGAAVAIPLPIFDAMLNDNGTAFAQGTELPRRYCTWFFGNGILPGKWNPSSTAADWALSEELAPLANVKNWLTVVSGLRKMIPNNSPHPSGSAAATTGANVENNSASMASIDQIVADVNIGGDFRSLEIGVSDADPDGPENTLHTVSHRGPAAPNYPEYVPHTVFTRMFTNRMDPGTVEDTTKLIQVKRSILDAVLDDGAELDSLLSSNDRKRLSDHLEAIRAIERRLEMMPTTPLTIPEDPETLGVGKDTRSEAPAAVNEVMAEMLAVGLASDITRNATLIFTLPAAHAYFRQLGQDMDDDFHNTISHGDAGTSSDQPRVHRGVVYTMECLAVFLEKLAALPEGAGTVLDNSLVYVTSCTAWGKVHEVNEWPVLFAGKAGGALQGNQHYRAADHNLSEALMTIAKIFGSPLTSIGKDQGRVTAELSGLRIG